MQSRPCTLRMTKQFSTYALCSGLLLALASPLMGWGVFVFLALIPLLLVLTQPSIPLRRAMVCGFLTGIPLYVALSYWLFLQNISYAVLAVAGLSLTYAVAVSVVILGVRARLRGSWLALWITLAWTMVEILTGRVPLTPSCGLGYGLWNIPFLIQGARWVGVHGLSAWIVGLSSLAVVTRRDGARACRGAWLGWSFVTLAFLAGGQWIQKEEPEATLQVAVVQSNVNTAVKTEPNQIQTTLEGLRDETLKLSSSTTRRPELIVWPETSVPVFLRSINERTTRDRLMDTASEAQATLLVGALAQNNDDPWRVAYNAAFFIPPEGFIEQAYYKQMLVPFYETVPLFGILPEAWRTKLTSLAAGRKPGILHLENDRSLGVLICWEALSAGLVRELAQEQPGFLVNITNDDAAFGPAQRAYRIPLPHLVLRAVETGRHLIRCSNRGTSLHVDAYGRIKTNLPWGEAAATTWAVPYYTGQTPYVRFGGAIELGMLLLTVGWGIRLMILVRSKST